MTSYTVSAAVPRLIAEILTSDRIEQESIYRRANLDPALMDDVDGRISYEDLHRFARTATTLARAPHPGLSACNSFFPRVLDIVGFTMIASASLFQTLAKYSSLVDESVEVSLRREATTVVLTARSRLGKSLPIIVDVGFSVLLRILRLLSAGRPVRVQSACFSYPPPADISLHAATLGCQDLSFSDRDNSIAFLLADIDQPIPKPSKIVSTLLNEVAADELAFLKRATLTSIKVREVIARGVGGHALTLSATAAALRTSPRALQRALEREDTSFSRLVDEIHRQHAHLRLRHSPRSIKEIAYELGFIEQRSFYRACIRWFGVPPAVYRNRRQTIPKT